MNNYTNFESIYADLESFSPKLEDSDLFIPLLTSSNIFPSPLPSVDHSFSILRLISQNVNKSNHIIHSLVNVSSLWPFSTDIILIQEPWYAQIDIDVTTGKDIYGTPSHKDWMCILPVHGKEPPDVAIYVPKQRNQWHIQICHDLFTHPSIIALDVITRDNTFLLINVYNPSNNSSLGHIVNFQQPPHSKTLIVGDFNLHHPLWSKDIHAIKISPESELLVDSLSSQRFLPLNSPRIETFSRKDYSSILDLLWCSHSLSPHLTDFKVNFPIHTGSDHYPLTWSLHFHPLASQPSNYLFHKDKKDKWIEEFQSKLQSQWNKAGLYDYLPDSSSFNIAVDLFMDNMISASQSICSHITGSPRAAKWFDKEF